VCRQDSSGSGLGPVVDSFELGDEPSGSIKGWEFLDSVSNCWLLKKDTALWSGLVTCLL
jgi:hypothetical protein